MKAYITMGCHGARRYGFSICRGTTNPIVDLRKLGVDAEEIMSYLDSHCKIFDKVVEDLNQINNIIQMLNRYSVIPQHMLELFYSYIAMHRGCGLYMFVDPIEPGGTDAKAQS